MAKDILFYLSFGHGQDGDPGAVSGNFVEREIAEETMDACYKYLLQKRGAKDYKVAYPEKNGKGMHIYEHNEDVKKYSKKYRVVSIDYHMNAGKGDGCEAYCKDTSYSRVLGDLICKELKKIGQNYHGNPIKGDNDLMFLKNAGTSVLVEGGYVDNKNDRKLFNTKTKQQKMGIAVAKALIKYYNKYN